MNYSSKDNKHNLDLGKCFYSLEDAMNYVDELKKNKQMTQQDKVIKVFLDLLSKGEVTTLDVKLKLRADYPMEYWTQDFISVVLADYQDENDTQVGFRDNGHYRTYYKIVKISILELLQRLLTLTLPNQVQ